MLAEKNVHLAMSPVLLAEMEAVAEAEGKTLDEIAQNAVQRFLEDRYWQQLVGYGHDKARNLGFKSSDVPRLIAGHVMITYQGANAKRDCGYQYLHLGFAFWRAALALS